ncbi:MAG: AtpZ/AtpI family protein [bacterium]|nr:AtpZ/AtpI family protein [bacterium]
MKVKKKHFRQARSWLDVSIVGIQFPVAILIGYFWGKWMDGMFGTWPWLTGVFFLFGVVAGFVNLFRITAQAARSEEREARAAAEAERENHGDDGDVSR